MRSNTLIDAGVERTSSELRAISVKTADGVRTMMLPNNPAEIVKILAERRNKPANKARAKMAADAKRARAVMWFTESGRPPLPGSRTLSGHAIKWNVRSAVRSDYDELFEPHSMDITRDIRANINHNRDQVIASTEAGTLRIRFDDVGLWVELDCPPTEAGDRLLEGSRFGSFTGWSIAFRATAERWDRTGDRPLRIVQRANLGHVALADRGAHVTTIGVLSRMQS